MGWHELWSVPTIPVNDSDHNLELIISELEWAKASPQNQTRLKPLWFRDISIPWAEYEISAKNILTYFCKECWCEEHLYMSYELSYT